MLNIKNDIALLQNKKSDNGDMLLKNQSIVLKFTLSLNKIEGQIQSINEKELIKLEKDFSSLIKPSLLP